MPNIWTHMMFADKLADDISLHIDQKHQAFFNLGAQGPDPFFYHNFWPWKKEKPVEKIGAEIHYHNCGSFLMDMISYGVSIDDEKLRAYIYGFITHHILDRNAHPYIIYRSGDQEHRHQRLEVIIDTLLMEKHYHIKTWKTPVYKKLNVGKHLYQPIVDMLDHLIQTHFPETRQYMPENYIDQSYRDMLLAQRLLFDPLGWKNRLLGDLVSPYSYKKNIADADYLNEAKSEWLHPTDQSEKHTESFYDLWDAAEDEGQIIIKLIHQYFKTGDAMLYSKIKNAVQNRSYDTGKECTLAIENKYYDPIL